MADTPSAQRRLRMPRARTLVTAVVVGFVGATAFSNYRRKRRMAVIHDDTILHWKITNNSVVEARNEMSPFAASRLLQMQSQEESAKELTLLEVVRALKLATQDDRITGLCARFVQSVNPRQSLSFGQLQELRQAVEEFKHVKKEKFGPRAKIVAFSETLEDQWMYFMASSFDKIVVQPTGNVFLQGIGTTVPFFKNTLEKLGIRFTVQTREEFKSGLAFLNEHAFSKPQKENMVTLLEDINEQLFDAIAISRVNILPLGDITARKEKLRSLISSFPIISGREALAAGLIDGFGYRDMVAAAVIAHPPKSLGHYLRIRQEEVNDITPGSGSSNALQYGKVAILPSSITTSTSALVDKKPIETTKKVNVAVVYFLGNVTRSNGQFSAANVSYALRQAAMDPSVDAIVLRVDSPGGDVVASDTVWGTVRRVQAITQKPVVASYAGVSASGGYYLSCSADAIVANPGTITGSIGVLYARMTVLPKLLEKLGITIDDVHFSNATKYTSPLHELDESAKQSMSRFIDIMYFDFIRKVAHGRGKSEEEISQLAKGRVYTGQQALAVGLVDCMGGLHTATRIAAQMALARRAQLDEAIATSANTTLPHTTIPSNPTDAKSGSLARLIPGSVSIDANAESYMHGEHHILTPANKQHDRDANMMDSLHQDYNNSSITIPHVTSSSASIKGHKLTLDQLLPLPESTQVNVTTYPRPKSFFQRMVEAQSYEDLVDIFWFGVRVNVMQPFVNMLASASKDEIRREIVAMASAAARPSVIMTANDVDDILL